MNTVLYSGVLLLICIEGQHAAFSGKECLNHHNTLRTKHDKTQPLRYSKELEKSAQTYADQLAVLDDDKSNPVPTRDLPKRRRRAIPPTTDPFFHKEMWDGEILYPLSKWDLNKDRKIPIGESIHKFCCYSFPYCPSDFFDGLNFPPSAKGIIGNWYKQMKNYDFAKGTKKNPSEEIKHFTNIVWKKSTEVGCAQSKRSKKGCIYTVVRYRVQGSIGQEDDYKNNVGSTTPVADEKQGSSQSYLTAFIIVLFVVLILVVVVIGFIKRAQIRAMYAEYQIKRSAKKAEASLRDDYDEESSHGRKSIIYKPSSRKARPSIRVIQNISPVSTLPMTPRRPTLSADRMSIIYKPGTDQCSVIKNEKPLPPRPLSPVKAETPPLRPASQNIIPRKDRPPPHPLQRASLPPPPPPPSKPTADKALGNNESQDSGSTKPNVCSPLAANKVVFEPKVETKPTAIKKPLPVPSGKPSSTASVENGIPKPAPRPGRPRRPSDQQFESRQPPSRAPASRASRKNPNFRTLPLNDRGSVKAENKTTEEGKIDWRSQLKKTNATKEDKPQEKLPVVPEGKKVPQIPRKNLIKKDTEVNSNQQKKPLLPKKNIGNGDNKGTDNDKPMSVLERRKLLENENRK